METKIRTNSEVTVTAPDDIGVLSRITTAVAEAHVNIDAVCAYAVDGVAHVRLLTDNCDRAVDMLNRTGFKAAKHEVLRCELSPHVIHPDMEMFAEGYDVKNNYWCAATHSGEHALLVFSPESGVRSAGLR